jgi:hypothetical protein
MQLCLEEVVATSYENEEAESCNDDSQGNNQDPHRHMIMGTFKK